MTDKLKIAPSVPLDEVEWRVDGKPSRNNTARFVPYVDATTTARLLDEWVGPNNWKDAYEPGDVAGKPALWCYLSVKNGDEWVTKRDVGVASNFEAQKGMVSDAFKRVSCIKWGVARNVYSLPTLWAPCRVDDKGNAWPTDQTLPTIHRELKKLGYEASGRLSASQEETKEVEQATGTPAPRSEGVPSQAVQLAPELGMGGEVTPSDSSLETLLAHYKPAVILKHARRFALESGNGEFVPTKTEQLGDVSDRVLELAAQELAKGHA